MRYYLPLSLSVLFCTLVLVPSAEARPEQNVARTLYTQETSNSFPLALSNSEPPELLVLELGEEYSEHSKPVRSRSADPRAEKESRSLIVSALLYLPNRVMDLLDIFRVDAGIGPSFGAAVRVTKWGQVAYRDMSPASLRLGLRGRRSPIFLERTSEFGIGPLFLGSKEREVTPFELGVGADIFLVGVYAGISFDEIFDFFAGIVGFDPSDDGF